MTEPLQLSADPIEQFKQWYKEARESRDPNYDVMLLATVSQSSKSIRPMARIVLYKGMSQGGFLFYTNYGSQKAIQLDNNAYASVVFYWEGLYRQVRIEGIVERLDETENDTYFAARPVDSQLAAWASQQSKVIEHRAILIKNYKHYQETFKDKVPRPPFWGGYRLIPDQIEFWIGYAHRLHDRFLYQKTDHQWKISQLSP